MILFVSLSLLFFLVDAYGRPRIKTMQRRLGSLRLGTVIGRKISCFVTFSQINHLPRPSTSADGIDPPSTENTRSSA